MMLYLIFYDWLNSNGESVYFSEAGMHLTNSDFHHGSSFEAELTLDESEEADLMEAMEAGFTPVFTVSLPKERLTARGHQHAEAFCLMSYKCEVCGHQEIFWNSRDGVTPFGCNCPNCKHGSMLHVDRVDAYDPEYMPFSGQGVWIDMPEQFKSVIARMRANAFEGTKEEREALIEALTKQFQPGEPWLIRWP